MSHYISVYLTATSRDEADRIAQSLVRERLAACVNVIDGVRSIYRWEGKIEEAEELVMIAKTRSELFEPLETLVKSLHSQSCPCIVATPLTKGHAPYFAWISAETTGNER